MTTRCERCGYPKDQHPDPPYDVTFAFEPETATRAVRPNIVDLIYGACPADVDVQQRVIQRWANQRRVLSNQVVEGSEGYPPRSEAPRPDEPVLWVGKNQPPTTSTHARAEDVWAPTDES